MFQRTPNFSLPAKNAPLDPQMVRRAQGALPRAPPGGPGERASACPARLPEQSALEVAEEEREATLPSAASRQGNLVGMLLAYNDLITDKEANDTAAEYVRQRIREIVDDPEVAEKLCPTDHPLGTKRPCLDTDYYATYNRPHVELVDLKQDAAGRGHRAGGAHDASEEFEFDSIVFATGFDAMTGSLMAFDIEGRDGVLLKEKWAAGPRTYLGVADGRVPQPVDDHRARQPVGADEHDDLDRAARGLDRRRHRPTCATTTTQALEPTVEAQDEWTDHVTEVGNTTLYPSANSWYMGSNVPGKPRVFLPYIGGVGVYRERVRRRRRQGLRGLHPRPDRVGQRQREGPVRRASISVPSTLERAVGQVRRGRR